MHLSRTQRLVIVTGISSSFFITEITIGFKTHSLALIADAFHYLSDLISFMVALVAIRIVKHDSPQSFSYGWQRAQLLGAFFNGVFLAALGLSILLQSIERFIRVERVDQPLLTLIMGAVGFGLNIVSAVLLGHQHGHDREPHNEARKHTVATSDKLAFIEAAIPVSPPLTEDTNEGDSSPIHQAAPSKRHSDLGMSGVMLHVAGDAVNNIGVMISACIIKWTSSPKRYYADPAISLFIALVIIASSIPLILSSARVLLQAGPEEIDVKAIHNELECLTGVDAVHELHIWSLDQQKTIASAHVVLDEAGLQSWCEVARQVGECLHAYGIHSFALQPEPRDMAQTAAVNSTADEEQSVSGFMNDGGREHGVRESGIGATAVVHDNRGGMRRRIRNGGRCRMRCKPDCEEQQCCGD